MKFSWYYVFSYEVYDVKVHEPCTCAPAHCACGILAHVGWPGGIFRTYERSTCVTWEEFYNPMTSQMEFHYSKSRESLTRIPFNHNWPISGKKKKSAHTKLKKGFNRISKLLFVNFAKKIPEDQSVINVWHYCRFKGIKMCVQCLVQKWMLDILLCIWGLFHACIDRYCKPWPPLIGFEACCCLSY